MSKVKSAIITVLLVVAMVVAAFFATISFPVSATQRYNSMVSSIHLGGDYTGNIYTTLYPENVISAQDYKFLDEEDAEEYTAVGGVYAKVESTEELATLKENVAYDAKVLNARFAQKGYSGYSVSVEDGLTIKISVPSNYTYASYKGNNSTDLSTDLSNATSALSALTAGGEVTLRTTETSITTSDDDSYTYTPRKDEHTTTALVSSSNTYALTKVTEDVNDFFKSVSSSMYGSTAVITLRLTTEGRERIKDISTLIASSDSQTLYMFMGDTQMLAMTCSSTIDESKIQLSSDSSESAENIAIALNSALTGNALKVTYSDIEDVNASTATAGENAALLTFVASLVILVLAIVLLCVKYKKLGGVLSLISVLFALVIVYALYILDIQLTFVGLLTAIFGLAVFITTNIIVFEEIRRQTSVGKTMQASIKAGYKRTIFAVLDIHIILLVASILATAVGVGEVATCGFIMIIATIASYILYWFTRLMWYVISSPARDKFKFGGYKRVVYDD